MHSKKGGYTDAYMAIIDRFNEIALDENGDLIKLIDPSQLKDIVVHVEKFLKDVEKELEYFLDN